MPKVECWFKQDLKKPVKVQTLNGNVFTLDNVGSLIGVEVYDNGSPATLSGSVNGYIILPDDTTVSVAGTRSGNKVSINLPQSALAIPGFIKIAVKLTNSSEITTLLAVVATVYKSRTDTIITPSQQIITDWSQQISASLQQNADLVAQSVKFGSSQSLTDAQKQTARTNIGAVSTAELADETTAREAADSDLKTALNGIKHFDPADFELGKLVNGAPSWDNKRIRSINIMEMDTTIKLTAANGYQFGLAFYNNGTYVKSTVFVTSFILNKGEQFKIVISKTTEEVISDLPAYVNKVSYDFVSDPAKAYTDELKTLYINGEYKKEYSWENGNISNGAEQANAKRKRTIFYEETADASYIEIKSDDIYINVFYYNSSKEFVRSVTSYAMSKTTILHDQPYFKLCVIRKDGETIADNDFSKFIVWYKVLPDDTTAKDGYSIANFTWVEGRILDDGTDGANNKSARSAEYIPTSDVDYVWWDETSDIYIRLVYYNYNTVSGTYSMAKYKTAFQYSTEIEKNYTHVRVWGSRANDAAPSQGQIQSAIEMRKRTSLSKEVHDIVEYGTFDDSKIVANNQNAISDIIASQWTRSATAHPWNMLHFSDIHNWTTPLERIVEFRNYLKRKTLLDDAICTGDIVKNAWDDNTFKKWTDTYGTSDMLFSIGNHDTYAVGTMPHGKLTTAQKYANYFADLVSGWNVTMTADTSYFYKDYPTKSIRLIVCDPAVEDSESDQLTWLQNALSGAKTLGYTVVVASHFLVCKDGYAATSVDILDNNWSNNLARETGTDIMAYDWDGTDIVGAVTDFISAGGSFACYLIGHTHTDILSHPTGHPEQLIINVACASADRSHETPLTTNDLPRYEGTPTEDAFNIVTVDAENKILKVVRVGANMNMYHRERKSFCWDFGNSRFLHIGTA